MIDIPHEIKRSKRKTLALEVDSSARLVVRAPHRVSDRMIQNFLLEKRQWIRKAVAEMQQRHAHKQTQYSLGSTLLYQGRKYTIRLDTIAKSPFALVDDCFVVTAAQQSHVQAAATHWYKRRARQLLIPRTRELATQFGYEVKSIRITQARTRWGSCSGTNNISFSWRLMQAPPHVIDYVIIHELVHTVHKNHGKRFWARVAKHDPDFHKHKKWLSDKAIELDI